MDLYNQVTGDVEALKEFDKLLGGYGNQTVSYIRSCVEQNSRYDKPEPVIDGASPYFKTDYELFQEHHKILMQEFAATQYLLNEIISKKNDVKSIGKLSELCEKHNCANIGELYVQKQDDAQVIQAFTEFQHELENDLSVKKNFNTFAKSFEAYKYNIDLCNQLSGLDQPFEIDQPNEKQLNFIAHSGKNIKQTLLEFEKLLNQQHMTVDSLKKDANYTAQFPIATTDKNLFFTAATEVYVVQSSRYQDAISLIKKELKHTQELGRNTFEDHFKEFQKQPAPIDEKSPSPGI